MQKDGEHFGAHYLKPVTMRHHLKLITKFLVAQIKACDIKFNTIVFRGQSGSLIAPIIAIALNKHILFIRKPSDSNHSSFPAEGNIAIKGYIIIDDFVSSGKTIDSIFERISEIEKSQNLPISKCVGIFLYMSSCRPTIHNILCHTFSISMNDNEVNTINGYRIEKNETYSFFIAAEKAAGRKPTFKKWVNSFSIQSRFH